MARKRKPETPPPECLTAAEKKRLGKWVRGHDDPQIRVLIKKGPGGIADLVEECLNWHRAEDRWRRDWVATCENWMKKHVRWKVERRQEERPQHDLDKRESGMASVTHISDVMKRIS